MEKRGTKRLAMLRDRLEELQRAEGSATCRIPQRWIEQPADHRGMPEHVAPFHWLGAVVERILASPGAHPRPTSPDAWSEQAVVYNLFVRAGTAFDHDGDGHVGPGVTCGLRETGTLAKAVALLPYIRDLGCNVVHLLPISAIGVDGRKGTLGSPYAARDPYRIDETLAEPALGLGAEIEFGAFVEAAHHLGLRVVAEFALRTAARDSDWVADHPEWFYWIRGEGPLHRPVFSKDALVTIEARVAAGRFEDLPPPSPAYRGNYVDPREIDEVARVDSRWVARLRDGSSARIPGAFADWPPDDAQPPWNDVTYLRLYDHPDFNYMAYNTLRMYDARLARRENALHSLWERIVGTIPHFEREFGIDGALIDMGHALPNDLKAMVVEGVRRVDEGFAVWDEAFEPTERARAEGYDAVVGSLWWALQEPDRLRERLSRWSERQAPLASLATPETHNTPRCAARTGGTARSRLTWVLGAFLPALPFVHSGFELGETDPINTGLDFTPEELARHPEDRLGLYNPMAYDWSADGAVIETIRRSLAIREMHRALVIDRSPGSLRSLDFSADARFVGYARVDEDVAILVVGVHGGAAPMEATITVPLMDGDYRDALGGRPVRVVAGDVSIALDPWEVILICGRRRAAED